MNTTYGRLDQYKSRMAQLEKLLRWILRYKKIILSVLAAIVATLSFLGFAVGAVVSFDVPVATYGEAYEAKANVFLSDVAFQYSEDGETWIETKPTLAGNYYIRTVTRNGFGGNRYGRAKAFAVAQAPLYLSVHDMIRPYGSTDPFLLEHLTVEGLMEGDHLSTLVFEEKTKTATESAVSLASFAVLCGERDVTSCYAPTIEEGRLTYGKRLLTVGSGTVSKPYDGTPLSASDGFIAEGTLATGDSIVYEPVSVLVEPGTGEAAISARITNEKGEDVTWRYDIVYQFGELCVTPSPITLTLENVKKEYDGTPLLHGKVSVTKGTLPAGCTLQFTYSADAQLTYVGTKEVSFDARIMQGSRDITHFFDISCVYGSVTIRPRPITVASYEESKVYDGTPLYPQRFYLKNGTLVSGETLSYRASTSGGLTDVGTAKGEFFATVTNKRGEDMTGQYHITYEGGTLTVTPRPITIRTGSSYKIYDGKPADVGFLSVTRGTLVKGHGLTALYTGRTDAGEYINNPTIRILDKGERDVTKNYQITVEYGKITIEKRAITVLSGSEEKGYDGKPLTCKEFSVVSGTPVYGHIVSASMSGSQTEIGESPNTIASVSVTDESGIDTTKNYKISMQYGVLRVVEFGLPVEPDDNEPPADIPNSGESGVEDGNGDGKMTFYVTTERGGSLYLRQRSYMTYNGKDFVGMELYEPSSDTYTPLSFVTRVAQNLVESQTVIFRRPDHYVPMMVPYYTVFLSDNDNNYLTRKGNKVNYALTYTFHDVYVTSSPTVFESAKLNAAGYTSEEKNYRQFVKEHYMDVPANVRTVLNRLIAENNLNSGTQMEIITKVQKYIQGAARYNLNAAEYPANADHVIYFLTVAKEGVCEQYAEAATLMYRTLGIPARYTVGFMALTEAGKEVEVDESRAHAWVEIYLDGVGWVMVEVTGGNGGGEGSGSGSGEESSGSSASLGENDEVPFEIEFGRGDGEGEVEGGGDANIRDDSRDNVIIAKINSNISGLVYLRRLSYGDYTGNAWDVAKPYTGTGVPSNFTADAVSMVYGSASSTNVTLSLAPGSVRGLVPYYSNSIIPSSVYTVNDIGVKFQNKSNSWRSQTFKVYLNMDYGRLSNMKTPSKNTASESAYRKYVYDTYLTLPESTRLAMLKIAEQNGIRANSPTVVTDVQNYIQSAGVYNLDVAPYPQGVDVAVFFLTAAKEGFCQHFATAATAMYRALGIPARYTIGYLTNATAGEQTNVVGKDGHAWVEIYLDGVGWVMVEVTAGAESTGGGGSGNLQITVYGIEKIYDGRPLKDFLDEQVPRLVTGLKDGHRMEIDWGANADATAPGVYPFTVESTKVLDRDGNDVTAEYKIDLKINGNIIIQRRSIRITTPSATKKYDGTPLTASGWQLISGNVLPEHRLVVDVIGSQTNVGTSTNRITYDILDASGKSVKYMYTVSMKTGTLRVTK